MRFVGQREMPKLRFDVLNLTSSSGHARSVGEVDFL